MAFDAKQSTSERLKQFLKSRLPFNTSQRAIGIAKQTEMILKLINTGKINKAFKKQIPLNDWLSLYRDHIRLQSYFLDHLYPTQSDAPKTSLVMHDMQIIIRALSKLSPEEIQAEIAALSPEEQKEIECQYKEYFTVNKNLSDFLQDSAKLEPDKFSNDCFSDEAMQTAEMQFFLKVWTPCWFLYSEYPTRLFQRARNEDFNALIKLIKLDKAVIFEPRIASIIYKLSHFPCSNLYQKVMQATKTQPKKLSLKVVKAKLAGYASALYKPFGGIQAPDIQGFFDKNHQSQTQNKEIADPDIPTGETFSKAIQRHRPDWQFMFPDKN